MSRSQRHRTLITNYPADCKYGAQGVAAPGYRLQGAGPYVVPKGPNGGPLQGSSLAGPPPVGALPTVEHPLALLGVILSGGGPVNMLYDETSQGIEPNPGPPDFTNAPVEASTMSLEMETASSSAPQTAPQTPAQTAPQTSQRTFPMGAYSIVQVRYDDTLGQLVVQLDPVAANLVKNGDTVVIEATGNTGVNGTYEATNVSGAEFGIEMQPNPLTSVINDKGRVTIVDGGP